MLKPDWLGLIQLFFRHALKNVLRSQVKAFRKAFVTVGVDTDSLQWFAFNAIANSEIAFTSRS